jgi:hypothetical protein
MTAPGMPMMTSVDHNRPLDDNGPIDCRLPRQRGHAPWLFGDVAQARQPCERSRASNFVIDASQVPDDGACELMGRLASTVPPHARHSARVFARIGVP